MKLNLNEIKSFINILLSVKCLLDWEETFPKDNPDSIYISFGINLAEALDFFASSCLLLPPPASSHLLLPHRRGPACSFAPARHTYISSIGECFLEELKLSLSFTWVNTIHCIAHAALILLKGLWAVVRHLGLIKGISICKCYQSVHREREAAPSLNQNHVGTFHFH